MLDEDVGGAGGGEELVSADSEGLVDGGGGGDELSGDEGGGDSGGDPGGDSGGDSVGGTRLEGFVKKGTKEDH